MTLLATLFICFFATVNCQWIQNHTVIQNHYAPGFRTNYTVINTTTVIQQNHGYGPVVQQPQYGFRPNVTRFDPYGGYVNRSTVGNRNGNDLVVGTPGQNDAILFKQDLFWSCLRICELFIDSCWRKNCTRHRKTLNTYTLVRGSTHTHTFTFEPRASRSAKDDLALILERGGARALSVKDRALMAFAMRNSLNWFVKPSRWLQIREKLITYPPNPWTNKYQYTITSVGIFDLAKTPGGHAAIQSGGVGHRNVTIRLFSERSCGFNYKVVIHGR